MDIARMLQLALGVPDAVPAERREELAARKLVELGVANGFGDSEYALRAEREQVASEVVVVVAAFYDEGLLDDALCGVPTGPNEEPAYIAVLQRQARPN